MKDPFVKLVEIIKKTKIDCKFTLVDIGARPERNSQPRFHKIIADHLNFKENEMLVCGISIGYEDTNAPENSLRVEKLKYTDFTTFLS